MTRTIIVSFWACLVMLTSSFAMSHFQERRADQSTVAASNTFETKKTKEINVPKIKDGVIKGYIVAQLSYSINTPLLGKSLPPDAIVVDETFAYLYNDDSVDFEKLDKFDLKKMMTALTHNINLRLKADVVVDMGIQEFTFMPSPEVRPRL